jgi:uncharacterized protein YlzI (FlbEa/FlbD family)
MNIKNKTSLVITPITNIDFESLEVIDNTLLEELEVEPKTQLPVFNGKKQIQEKVIAKSLNKYHWYLKDGVLNKIIHIL